MKLQLQGLMLVSDLCSLSSYSLLHCVFGVCFFFTSRLSKILGTPSPFTVQKVSTIYASCWLPFVAFSLDGVTLWHLLQIDFRNDLPPLAVKGVSWVLYNIVRTMKMTKSFVRSTFTVTVLVFRLKSVMGSFSLLACVTVVQYIIIHVVAWHVEICFWLSYITGTLQCLYLMFLLLHTS